MNLSQVNQYIHPDLVIDIGACQGHFYKEAKEVWPDAEYFLVDANLECSEILESLNVDFTIATLSDKEKTVTLYTRKDSPCCTGVSYYRELTDFYKDDNAVPHKVHTKTLDNACFHLVLKNKKVLLKLDVQGAELDILKGSKVVVENCQGMIVEVSYYEYNQGAPRAVDVIEFVKNLGFANYGTVGRIVHPVTQDYIQDDILFLR